MLGLNRLRSVAPLAVITHFAGVAAVISLAGILFRPGLFRDPPRDGITILLILGVTLTGTTGQYCLTQAYTRGKPARMAVIGLTQVVFALVLDLALWGRVIDGPMALGFALVLVPSAWLAGLNSARMGLLNRARAGQEVTSKPTPIDEFNQAPEPAQALVNEVADIGIG